MNVGTAENTRGINAHGKLFQRRAFAALPFLVRQAYAGETIYYRQLADELGMPKALNLNDVLGAVADSLAALGSEWAEPIPLLHAVVINQVDQMPGAGFVRSAVDPRLHSPPTKRDRKRIVGAMLADVFAYKKWHQVLAHFGIAPVTSPEVVLRRAAGFRAGGESEAHRTLKELVAADPRLAGVGERVLEATVEYRLPTGDQIDVLLRTRRRVFAVEVKAAHSPEEDLARGVFQCVKYEALLNALSASVGVRDDVEAILVLAGALTPSTRALANTLGVRVLESVGGEVAGDVS